MNPPVPAPASPEFTDVLDDGAPPLPDLDPEEDIAPNLGGEDRMQDS